MLVSENTQFQKALRLMENDIWNIMLHGGNKLICPDCFIKYFLMSYSTRAMTLLAGF